MIAHTTTNNDSLNKIKRAVDIYNITPSTNETRRANNSSRYITAKETGKSTIDVLSHTDNIDDSTVTCDVIVLVGCNYSSTIYDTNANTSENKSVDNSNIAHTTTNNDSLNKMKRTFGIFNTTSSTNKTRHSNNSSRHIAAKEAGKSTIDILSRTETIDDSTVICGERVLVGCTYSSTIYDTSAKTSENKSVNNVPQVRITHPSQLV